MIRILRHGVSIDMRHRSPIGLLLLVLCISVAAESASACQCGGFVSGKNAWGVAQREWNSSEIIFEGTPVKFELYWSLLSAKEGEWVKSENSSFAGFDPHMVITFQVRRIYKGNLGTEVQLHTGLGGGDCGARYSTGLDYLVFASGSNLDQLSVSMCSPGGWIGASALATDLRLIRKEKPIAADLVPIRGWSSPDYRKQERQRQLAFQDERQRYAGATGRICGKVIRPNATSESVGSVSFLSTAGYSPFDGSDVSVGADGSFCSRDLGPGKYYVLFVSSDKDAMSVVYYPGVADVSKAEPIAVNAGHTLSSAVFKAPNETGHAVRGLVSANEKLVFHSVPSGNGVGVYLIRADGDQRLWYTQTVLPILPKRGYFKFENVLPGRYYLVAQVPASGWWAKKVELTVTTHMKFTSIDLLHKN